MKLRKIWWLGDGGGGGSATVHGPRRVGFPLRKILDLLVVCGEHVMLSLRVVGANRSNKVFMFCKTFRTKLRDEQYLYSA